MGTIAGRRCLKSHCKEIQIPDFRETRVPGLVRWYDEGSQQKGIARRNRYGRGISRQKIIVERGLDAREIEVAVLGNDQPKASIPGEIVPHREFYDYAAKYLEDGTKLLIPAPLIAHTGKKISGTRRASVSSAGLCRNGARGFLSGTATGRVYLNEINTIPGFTSISMYPKMWEASGIPYRDLISD